MKRKNNFKGTLLIVDDILENIGILFDFLTQAGFKVLIAREGEEAIRRAQHAHPDLILLDVLMPGMNGFEVCRTLKSQEETKEIPIIFMTALADTVDKVRGFQLGAADYITKPFQNEEVLARITTHFNVVKLQKELQQRNMELEAFISMVAHDLKNPLSVIMGFTDLLATDCSTENLSTEQALKNLNLIAQAGQEAITIIDGLLLLAKTTKVDYVEMQPLEMSYIIHQIIDQRLPIMIKEYAAEISLPETWPVAQGYLPWIEEVWIQYISNALKYGGQPPRLMLGADIQNDRMIRFWIHDDGPGLSSEAQKQLFMPLTRLHKERAEGHGLGLAIVRQIIDKQGGETGVESLLGQGSTFYFTLPAY